MVGTNLTGRQRSIWDLQWFDDRLYLGSGNTTTNPGSNILWSYSPTLGTINNEFLAATEAIEVFRVFNNRLFMPASDPTNLISLKFYYRDPRGGWASFSHGYDMAHVRDVTLTAEGDLIGVGNSFSGTSTTGLVRFDIAGNSLTALPVTGDVSELGVWPYNRPYNWGYSSFTFRGVTYATSALLKPVQQTFNPGVDDRIMNGILRYDKAGNRFVADNLNTSTDRSTVVSNDDFVPILAASEAVATAEQLATIYRVFANVETPEAFVYSLRSYSLIGSAQYPPNYYEDLYQNGHGLFLKTSLHGAPQPVVFPDATTARGEDVIKVEGVVYALANEKLANNSFIVSVHATSTPEVLSSWHELFRFNKTSRAKSFEYVDGIFYFGLGADLGEDTVAAGDILSYEYQTAAPRSPSNIFLSGNQVAEKQVAGALVGTLSSNDRNAGDTHTYSLSGADASAFSIAGNQLVTAASFNYATKNSYSVTVRSTDQTGLYLEKTLTVSVFAVVAEYRFSSASLASTDTDSASVASGIALGPGTGLTMSATAVSGVLRANTTINNPNTALEKMQAGRYVGFTVNATAGGKLNLTGFRVAWRREKNSPKGLTVFATADGTNFVTALDNSMIDAAPSPFVTFENVALASLSALQGVSSVEFRIVLHAGSDTLTNGLNDMDDIVVMGGVQPAAPPSTYAAAAAAMDWGSIPVNRRGPLDNSDGDAYNNFLTWAFGGSFTLPDTNLAPVVIATAAGNQTQLTQFYPKAVPGLVYQFKWSTDLVTWSADGVTAEQFDAASGKYYQTYTAPAGTPRIFGRLDISEP